VAGVGIRERVTMIAGFAALSHSSYRTGELGSFGSRFFAAIGGAKVRFAHAIGTRAGITET